VPRSLLHVPAAVLLVLCSGPTLAADPVTLTFRPEPGKGSSYSLDLTARLDYPLGRDVPVTAGLSICVVPRTSSADGMYDTMFCVQDGFFQLMGRKWDFSEESLAWHWGLNARRQVHTGEVRDTGLLSLLELAFRFVYSMDLPPRPVSPGESWESQVVGESGEGGTVTMLADHTVTEAKPNPAGEPTVTVTSKVQVPVDATFVGVTFVGALNAEAVSTTLVRTGEIDTMRVTGTAKLTQRGGALTLLFRDIVVNMRRTGEVANVEMQEWNDLLETRRGMSGSSWVDAILNSSVSKFMHDDWHVLYPRFRNTAADGTMLGAGVIGRYRDKFLYAGDVLYGVASGRPLGALSFTRGFPVQPKNQQFIRLSNIDGGRTAALGASHYSGRRLGSQGIPRMRYTAAATFSQLVPRGPVLADTGLTNYLTVGITRFRTGESIVGYHRLDWELYGSLSVGARAFGSDYDYAYTSVDAYGFYHFHNHHTLAGRLSVSWADGNVPDQFQTSLVDRSALRGFSLGDAPLVEKSIVGSLEYRMRIRTPGFAQRLGVRDWWFAAFVDTGIGGNTAGGLLRSKVFTDVGITGRARVKYLGIPLYVWASVSWPVAGKVSAQPRMTMGLDWSF